MPGFEIFGDEERREVMEVLETGVLMRYGFDGARKGRWKARELEAMLSERLGTRHAHVCSSGTTAVFTALCCCGVGADDEVIVPAFTFVADLEAILFAGAVPVFGEIDATLTLSVEGIEAAITPRTKAVLLVHMCGSMARVDAIRDLCEHRGLILIEDAAQAMGATYKGQALGSFGKAGCFSFDYVKTITCAEAGAVVTSDSDLFDKVQAFTDHGHDHVGSDRGAEKHPILGMNFRLSEIHAAVGIAQMRKLDRILEAQRQNKRVLKAAIADLPGVTMREVPDEEGDSATFLSFFLPDEATARAAGRELPKAGVDGTFYWYDNNWHYIRKWDHIKQMATPQRLHISLAQNSPLFTRPDLPVSDGWMSRMLSLQIKIGWSPSDLELRASRLRETLQRLLGA